MVIESEIRQFFSSSAVLAPLVFSQPQAFLLLLSQVSAPLILTNLLHLNLSSFIVNFHHNISYFQYWLIHNRPVSFPICLIKSEWDGGEDVITWNSDLPIFHFSRRQIMAFKAGGDIWTVQIYKIEAYLSLWNKK